MTLVQDIFARAMPQALATQMESEARAWIARCACGFGQSMWERGGVRWGGSERLRQVLKCPPCHAFTVHLVTREQSDHKPHWGNATAVTEKNRHPSTSPS